LCRVKVVEVRNPGTPSQALVVVEYQRKVMGDTRTFRLELPAFAAEWPDGMTWPPAVGDVYEVELAFKKV
jgi:hypothetical protein